MLKGRLKNYIRALNCQAAVLVFVLGWMAPAITLVSPEPITCGMSCCEESGTCCCFAKRRAHSHADGEEDHTPQITTIGSKCQQDCATLVSFSKQRLNHKAVQIFIQHSLTESETHPFHQKIPAVQSGLSLESAPRAPPFFC
jgi:hypothetical protein